MNAEQLLQHFERISEAPDAIPRLRRFILNLAVRGKLVAQDPSDEPAAELLKRIEAEKARLVKAGEIKADKTYERRESSNLKLPDGWLMVSLAEIVNRHLGGGTPSKSNHKYWDGPLLWASVKDVGKSKYLTTTIDRITEEGLENSSSNLITPGNLLVVTRMGLGKVSINTVPVAINQDLRALFMSSLIDIDYCYNFFLTHGFEGSGLTVKGIKIEELLSISFPLPPLAEQQRIVARVDELMSLCDQLEAAKTVREKCRDSLVAASLQGLNQPAEEEETFREHARFTFNNLPRITTRASHIKQLRQTILNLAVRGKLVPQDSSDEPASELLKRIAERKAQMIDVTVNRGRRYKHSAISIADSEKYIELPHAWSWARLRELGLTQTGSSPSSANPDLFGEEIPFIKPGDLDGKEIFYDGPGLSVEGIKHSRLASSGTVLMVCIGATLGKVNTTSRPICFNQQINSLTPVKGAEASFLEIALKSSGFQRLAWSKAGTGTLPIISKGKWEDLPIPLPPLAEQNRIVAKVDELMAVCDQLEAQITETEQDSRRFLEAVLQEALAPATAEAA